MARAMSISSDKPLSVGVVCDLREEEWPSMDLVAAMLLGELRSGHASAVEASELRPAMVRRATRVPLGSLTSLGRNVDRVANRFWDYPRWLASRTSAHDVYHLVDHSYAQLVHVLPPERTVVT